MDAHKWEEALEWTLQNPRRVTTQVFLPSETTYLAHFSLLFNLVVVVLFVSVEVYREALKEIYGSSLKILGIGFFQILNIRHCGFASIAMLDLTQGTLLVFCLAMYLSPLPFIGLLNATGETSLRQVQGKKPLEDEGAAHLVEVGKKVVIRFWFLKFALLFVLAAIEKDLMNDNPEDVNLWYIIFELVSAGNWGHGPSFVIDHSLV